MYFLAERGERRPDGRVKLLAYAVGCNPDTDPFDDWWELARAELGGDDFGEFFDPKDASFRWLSKNPIYDAEALVFAHGERPLVAVRYESQRPTFHFTEPKHPDAALYRKLMTSFPGSVVSFIDGAQALCEAIDRARH